MARERGNELLDFFALSHKKNAKVMERSGGMARRLILARALINQPDLLILDESTTGLAYLTLFFLCFTILALKSMRRRPIG